MNEHWKQRRKELWATRRYGWNLNKSCSLFPFHSHFSVPLSDPIFPSRPLFASPNPSYSPLPCLVALHLVPSFPFLFLRHGPTCHNAFCPKAACPLSSSPLFPLSLTLLFPLPLLPVFSFFSRHPLFSSLPKFPFTYFLLFTFPSSHHRNRSLLTRVLRPPILSLLDSSLF